MSLSFFVCSETFISLDMRNLEQRTQSFQIFVVVVVVFFFEIDYLQYKLNNKNMVGIIEKNINPRLTKGGCCNPSYGFSPIALKTLKKVTKGI